MAEKKPSPKPAPSPGINFISGFAFVFLIFLVLNSFFSNYLLKNNLVDVSNQTEQTSQNINEQNLQTTEKSFWDKILPVPKIELGKNIANKKDVEVRNAPAGQILGIQNKGQVARVVEGPISKFGLNWWRVDYPQAPSGFISEQDATVFVMGSNFINFFPWFFDGIKKILILIGIIALILIFIINQKIKSIRKIAEEKKRLINGKNDENFSKKEERIEEDEIQLPIAGLPIGPKPAVQNVTDRRWKNIKVLISSHNLNDWKQAIIEADIILDEMLDKMGYPGDSIGDKLKQIESSDFLTLNQAWEAHKVRNQIAHKGSNYVLSKDEAERVIELYEQIFKEFYYI